jgi:hypothetical protein
MVEKGKLKELIVSIARLALAVAVLIGVIVGTVLILTH